MTGSQAYYSRQPFFNHTYQSSSFSLCAFGQSPSAGGIYCIPQSMELLNIGAISSASIIVADIFPQFRSWLQLGIPVVMGILLLWEWIQVWGKDVDWFTWTASLTIVVSMLFVPHVSTEDYVLLLPIMVMLFGHWDGRWGASGMLATWFCLFTFGFGLWLLFFSASPSLSEPTILYFPVPLFCIIGLFWVRWWVIRRQHGLPRTY
jgi:hypothetical protein